MSQKYDRKFKLNAIKLYRESQKSLSSIAEALGQHCSRKRVAKLMKKANLQAKMYKKRLKITKSSKNNKHFTPNILNQSFNVNIPNKYWASDITYVKTLEGWIYISVVMDLFSRKIVGLSMDKSLHTDLVNQSLLQALFRRKPEKVRWCMNRRNFPKMLCLFSNSRLRRYGMAKKKVDWASYDKSLKQRGSITFWLSDEAIEAWKAEPSGKPGAQPKFSDLAIETSLTLRLVFKQGLRQTEGLIGSIFGLMELDLDIPDHSTLSRRGKVIDLSSVAARDPDEGLVIIVDSTGLKIYGAGEWSETKHGLCKRREWRKLHLTINESTLEITASSLTDNHVGDPTEVPNLLGQIKNPIDEFIGDGAYDTKKVYHAVKSRLDEGEHDVTVPPQENAVLSAEFKNNPTQRDEHVNFINTHSRWSWESKFQYYRRLLIENTMGRFKGIIGSILRSRDFEAQNIEIKIGCKILNRMVKLGTPLHPAYS